jgi:hypothetical protein
MSQEYYEFRGDGYYLARAVCIKCSEGFDVPAIANQRRICPACEQVDRWMQELDYDAS